MKNFLAKRAKYLNLGVLRMSEAQNLKYLLCICLKSASDILNIRTLYLFVPLHLQIVLK